MSPTMDEMRKERADREARESYEDGARLLFLISDYGSMQALHDMAGTIRESAQPLVTLRRTIDLWRKQAAEEAP
jgi:hypothetical protein